MKSRYDAIVIGGGHNGLVAAYYLADAGLDVLLCERRRVVGGPCATIEPFPGFRLSFTNSPGSFEPRIIDEMRLRQHGLTFVHPDPSLVHLLGPDEAFIAWRDRARTADQIAQFDRREPAAYQALMDYVEWYAGRLNVSIWDAPPSLSELAARMSTPEDEQGFARFFLGSIGELLDDYLLTPQMKAVVGTLSMMSTNSGPFHAGTAQMLLWRPLSKLSSPPVANDPRQQYLRGSTGLPVGGMGAITRSMESACRSVGVEIAVDTAIAGIELDDANRVSKVLTSVGDDIRTSVVLSCVDPATTLRLLRSADTIPLEELGLRTTPVTGNQFKVAIALDGLPRLRPVPRDGKAPFEACQFRLAPSLDYLDRAWDDAKDGRWSQGPIFWGLIPSVSDPTLAPDGSNIMSLNVYHAPSRLADDVRWADEKGAFANRCLDVLSDYYEDFSAHVIDHRAWSPDDLEAEFGMPGGNITYGDMVPARSFGFRPSPRLARYKAPYPGLYLGGSAMFPGGYITGVPGRNAAMTMLQDGRSGIGRELSAQFGADG